MAAPAWQGSAQKVNAELACLKQQLAARTADLQRLQDQHSTRCAEQVPCCRWSAVSFCWQRAVTQTLTHKLSADRSVWLTQHRLLPLQSKQSPQDALRAGQDDELRAAEERAAAAEEAAGLASAELGAALAEQQRLQRALRAAEDELEAADALSVRGLVRVT